MNSRRASLIVVSLVACGEIANPSRPEATLPEAATGDTGAAPSEAVETASRAVTEVRATTDLPDRVHLTWAAPIARIGLTGYRVYRDDAPLAEVGLENAFDDLALRSASLSAPLALTASDGTLRSGVVVAWQPAAGDGLPATHSYRIRAVYTGGDGPLSASATGVSAGSVTDYELSRDDGGSWESVGLILSVEDKKAPLATAAFATPSAVLDDSRSAIRLELPNYPTLRPTPATYRIRARSGAAAGEASGPAVGRRAIGSVDELTLQWQRSRGTGDGAYKDLPTVTGRVWFDDTSPMGEQRFFRVRVSADWVDAASPAAPATRVGFRSIAAGDFHTCRMRTDDKVVCWGESARAAFPPSGTTLTALATGGARVCGVRLDGSPVCWMGASLVPNAGSSSFKGVSAAETDACWLRSNDSVDCYGTPPTGTFRAISISTYTACGITLTGRLACWRWDTNYSQPPAEPNETFVAVTVGMSHACAVRADGALRCWGRNAYGEAPAFDAGPYVAVDSGAWHSTCALRSDGSLKCWGWQTMAATGSRAPASGGFKALALGPAHGCALRQDGSIACWGSNYWGQAQPFRRGLASTRFP
ncbi:MAG: hypothetical protein IPG50_38725 [Myxococcales bacterium]|nr:hypothetical protein [Myxococcales bacterium]